MIHRGPNRALHPLAWWGWSLALAASAMRTTNPLLLALIVVVVSLVVAERRGDAPWARSFGFFLRLGLFVIALRLLLDLFFGFRIPGTILFALPSFTLPDWAAGVSLGGPVTSEMLLFSFLHGSRLATVLICFGAANSLASPYRLLRSLPTVLYEAGVAVTVALSFTPEAVISAQRLRAARRLRGRPTSGAAALKGIGVPVLEGALDRSVALAASMDARGYGRRSGSEISDRRARVMTGSGLLALTVGLYALLDTGSPSALRLPPIGCGVLLVAGGLIHSGRRSTRTRYRPDRWLQPEWLTALSGTVALVGMIWVGRADPAALRLDGVEWPAVPGGATLAILGALLPAWVTPEPPSVTGPSPVAHRIRDEPVGANPT